MPDAWRGGQQGLLHAQVAGRQRLTHRDEMLRMAVRVIIPPDVVSSTSSAAAPAPKPTCACVRAHAGGQRSPACSRTTLVRPPYSSYAALDMRRGTCCST